MRTNAAKKYIFMGFFALSLAGFLIRFALGMGVFAMLFAWLAYENAKRTRFRFLKSGSGLKEGNFDLGAVPAQMEISASGSKAVFVTLDRRVSLRHLKGLVWERPLEAKSLAFLPLDDGSCYYAIEDELILIDARGEAVARLPFAAPEHRQSYSLLLSADSKTLVLHTPWFLQVVRPDLSALGPRLTSEETGHYMKYAALSPQGDRLYFAGAKLLDEGEGTQARWGCWSLGGDGAAPKLLWQQAEEGYGNSHLRGLHLSLDGSTLALELHREGYEFRILDSDGALKWRRQGGENPVLSPDGSLLLWENSYEGLTLTEIASQQKRWVYAHTEIIRFKSLRSDGSALVLEGTTLIKFDSAGSKVWQASFQTDPTRFSLSSSGLGLATLAASKGALLELPA